MNNEALKPSRREREPSKRAPMPPLELDRPLGMHAMHLMEGTDDVYYSPAPINWPSNDPVSGEPPAAHHEGYKLDIDITAETNNSIGEVKAGSVPIPEIVRGPLTEYEAWQKHTGFYPLLGKVDWDNPIPLEEMQLPYPGEDAEQDTLRAKLEAFERIRE